MWNRLRDNWVYGGFLAALMLLALSPILTEGWSLGLLLIWLHLPAYMLHQYEEHDADRFRQVVNATIGGGKEVLSRADVFIINIGGVWAVYTMAILLAARVHLGLGLVAVYISLVNSIGHLAQAVALRSYNPGLVTSILVFIPLGGAALWVMAGDVTAMDHLIGAGVAIVLHAAIILRVLSRRHSLT